MKLAELVDRLGLRVWSGAALLEADVRGGYASDLLSDVVANSTEGDLWVTLQTHENVVAVAQLRELAGVVVVGGREPDAETLAAAERFSVPVLGTAERTFEVVGRLIEAGVFRRRE